MARLTPLFLLLLLRAAAAGPLPASAGPDGEPPQAVPAGITCCDEAKIRAAMADEALRRIAAIAAGSPAGDADFLSAQAWEKVRRRLAGLDDEAVAGELRRALAEAGPDPDTRGFQELVGHFVLGMTLEIGLTFQDEHDQLLAAREKLDRLLSFLEGPHAGSDLGRALFHAGLEERELRSLRSLERRWKEPPADASAFDVFSALKRNVSGRAADPDQRLVFVLGERYRAAHPFLDEFLASYRKLAGELRARTRELNDILALKENQQ